MATEYYPNTFEPEHIAQDDLQNIETNFAALRSTFSGQGLATSVGHQMSVDTPVSGIDTLRIRNRTNTNWVSLFNVSTGEVNIVSTVRAGAIVDGEDIAPATCTIQGGGGSGGGGILLSDLVGGQSYGISVPWTSFRIAGDNMTTQVYVTGGQQFRGKAHCTIDVSGSVEVRFVIGGYPSSVSGLFTPGGSGAWSSQVDLTAVGTGWQTLQWEIRATGVSQSGTASIRGHNISAV